MATGRLPLCFEPGFQVVLRLRPDTAPQRSYVGEIIATDEHGVRVTLMDWLVGDYVSQDMYVPWANIEMAYVARPEHTLPRGALGRWQEELDPTPEVLVDRLAEAFGDAAEQETDPKRRRRLREIASAFGETGRDLAVEVAARVILRQTGMG